MAPSELERQEIKHEEGTAFSHRLVGSCLQGSESRSVFLMQVNRLVIHSKGTTFLNPPLQGRKVICRVVVPVCPVLEWSLFTGCHQHTATYLYCVFRCIWEFGVWCPLRQQIVSTSLGELAGQCPYNSEGTHTCCNSSSIVA